MFRITILCFTRRVCASVHIVLSLNLTTFNTRGGLIRRAFLGLYVIFPKTIHLILLDSCFQVQAAAPFTRFSLKSESLLYEHTC